MSPSDPGATAAHTHSTKQCRARACQGPTAAQEVTESTGTKGWQVLSGQVRGYVPGTLVQAVLYLATSAVMTRLFSAKEYGEFALFFTGTQILSAVACQWLQQSINRFLPGLDEQGARRSLTYGIAVALIAVILPFCLVVGASSVFVAWCGGRPAWLYYLVPATLILVELSFYGPITTVLQASMRARRVSAYQVSDASLRFGLGTAIVLLVFHSPAGWLWAIACSLGIIVPLAWHDAGMPRVGADMGKHSGARSIVSQLARYGLPMTGVYVSFGVLSGGDRYIIEWLRGSHEVGIYAANFTLVAGGMSLLSAPITSATHPFLVAAWNRGAKGAAGAWVGRAFEWFFQLGVLSVAGLVVFGEDVARLVLGREFRQGWPVMPIVLCGLVAWQLGNYAHKPLEFAGRTATMFGISMVAALLSVGLNVALVPRFGYMAAAFASVLAYSCYTVLSFWVGRSVLRVRVDWKGILTRGAVIAFAGVVLAVLKREAQAQFGYAGGLGVAIIVAAAGGAVFVRIMLRGLVVEE